MYALCPNSRRTLSNTGARNERLQRKIMIARYFGYMALGILFVIVLIGAYFLGK